MKMKAVITVAPKTSVLKEFDVPEINEYQVLIKTTYCGVCHSERYDWGHKESGAYGHEPVGVVEKVGEKVTQFAPGDRICGLWGSTLPGSGAMIQYAVADVRHNVLMKIPDHIRDVDAIVEPLSCMFSAVSKVKCSMPGTHVCVVGCGYMGCGAISLLKKRGCYVVAVDIRESSRKDALTYGADEAYSPEEALEKFVHSGPYANTLEAGFEVVMEWGENNESLGTAVKLTKICGQLCVGAYHTGPKREIDLEELGVKAIDLHNTHPREYHLSVAGAKNAVEMLDLGAWNYKNIPTMIYPMNKFDQAMADMETKYGTYMKSVINMQMEDGEPYMAE